MSSQGESIAPASMDVRRRQRSGPLAWLRRVHEAHPRVFSLSELLLIFTIFVLHRWAVPFWHWGIYRLELPVPDSLSAVLYTIWLEKDLVRGILIGLLICVIATGIIVRRTTFRQLGIRIDNLRRSGRECLVVLAVFAGAAAAILIAYPDSFSFNRYFEVERFWRDFGLAFLSGIVQQFLLQGIFLARALETFRRKHVAVFASSLLFSLLHTPNPILMALTFTFGFICSELFLRNRNIITLGILHGFIQQIVRVMFASLVVSGMTYYGLGYYQYNLRVGPHRADPHFLAAIQYDGDGLTAAPSQKIIVPLSVLNMSISGWDSNGKNLRTLISYHLLDSERMMASYDNALTPFPTLVEPGETAVVDLAVDAPAEPGDYFVEVDLLKQQIAPFQKVSWYRYRGSNTVFIPLTVR